VSDRLFYIETDYQFLQSMSLVVDFIDNKNVSCMDNTVFVDATREKCVFSKRRVLKDNFGIDVLSVNVYSFYFSAVFSSFLVCKLKRFRGYDFFMFNNRSPIVNKLSSILSGHGDVFQVEEGLSLYRKAREVGFLKGLVLKFKKSLVSLFTLSNFTDHIGHTVYADTVYLRYPCLAKDNEFLFKKKLKALPSFNNLTSISSVLNQIYSFDRSSFFDFDSDCMVFFGQPLSELGLLDSHVELDVLKSIGRVVHGLGFRLIVKVHPAENISKYDGLEFVLIEGKVPAEVIFMNYKNVRGVISFYSTAALNVAEMLNVTAYFFYKACGLEVNFPHSKNIRVLDSLKLSSLRSAFQFG